MNDINDFSVCPSVMFIFRANFASKLALLTIVFAERQFFILRVEKKF
jgi:hypothetical protein